jgi:chromosomal replication initiator protein
MNAKQVWQAALGELQLQMSRANFEVWLKNTSMVALEDGLAVIGVPNTFAKEWLEKRFMHVIRGALINVLGYTVDVKFRVMRATEPAPEMPLLAEAREPVGVTVKAALAVPEGVAHKPGATMMEEIAVNPGNPSRYEPSFDELAEEAGLNPKYSFERFIVGDSNRLAHAAAKSVAERPGQSHNPLFIYGGVGLGKTHLLHAIGLHVLRKKPDLRVRYVSSEKFTNDLILAIQNGSTEQFRKFYRRTDVLLIDDIQFIAGKEQTQEEFFHTFNELHGANKAIVLTSDRPPREIATLESRLRSRFEGGLLADIRQPDYETRVAILRRKADEQGVHLPPDVVDFLAERAQNNIRELEGALNRVIACAQLRGSPINMKIAMEAVNDIFGPGRRRIVTPGRIIETVAAYFGVSASDLKGKTRAREIVVPRQIAMYLIREETDITLAEIGLALGGRDHTTVIHSCEKVAREVQKDPELRQTVNTLRQMLYSDSGA